MSIDEGNEDNVYTNSECAAERGSSRGDAKCSCRIQECLLQIVYEEKVGPKGAVIWEWLFYEWLFFEVRCSFEGKC